MRPSRISVTVIRMKRFAFLSLIVLWCFSITALLLVIAGKTPYPMNAGQSAVMVRFFITTAVISFIGAGVMVYITRQYLLERYERELLAYAACHNGRVVPSVVERERRIRAGTVAAVMNRLCRTGKASRFVAEDREEGYLLTALMNRSE